MTKFKYSRTDPRQHLLWMIEGAEALLHQHRHCLVDTTSMRQLHTRLLNAKKLMEQLDESSHAHTKPPRDHK